MPVKQPDKLKNIPQKSLQPTPLAFLITALLLSPFFAMAALNHLPRFWVRSTPVQIGMLLIASVIWCFLLSFILRALARKARGMSMTGKASVIGFCLLLAGLILIPFIQDFTPLPPGQHELLITAIGEKNPASSSTKIKVLELTAADGQSIPLHTLEPRGEWLRLNDPQPALFSMTESPASLHTLFNSQWGQPVNLLVESGPDTGQLRVEIDDLSNYFDLYATQPNQRMLTILPNTAPIGWKLLLYSSDILLLAFLLLLAGILLIMGTRALDGLFERRPRQTAMLLTAGILLVFILCFVFFLRITWQKSNGLAAMQAGMALWSPWELVFLANFLLVSGGLGLFLQKKENTLPLPPLSRFLFGVCLAPILISLWMFLCAAILPGAPAAVFLFCPPAAGLVYLLFNLRQFSTLWQDICQGLNREINKPALALAWLCLAVILAQISSILLVNSRISGFQNDTNVYRSMAKPFAETRRLQAIPSFDGASHPNLPQDTHNYLFQGYLAYAMLHTAPGEIGFPNDKPVNDAYQVLIFGMLLALTALVWSSRRALAVPLALFIMLQVSQIGTISYIFSRDAFRIIPLLLLVLLLGIIDPSKPIKGRDDFLRLMLLGLVSFFCLAGHTLGGILCALVCLGWLVWQLFLGRKVRFASLLLIGLAAALGLLLGGHKYLQGYLTYGTVHVNIPEIITRGTVYPEIIVQVRDARFNQVLTSTGMGSRLLTTSLVILERDRYMVALPGMLVGLAVILFWRRTFSRFMFKQLLFWSLASLIIFFPFLGFLDIGKIILSKAFVGNLRYSLHLYPLFAAILSITILSLGESIGTSVGLLRQKRSGIFLTGIILVLFFSCLSALNRKDDNFWRVSNLAANQLEYTDTILPIRHIQAEIYPEKVLYNTTSYAYYLEDNAVFLYGLGAREIISSHNQDEARDAIEHAGIAAVVIKKMDIEHGMEKTTLYQYLQKSGETEVILDNNEIRLYRLRSDQE